MILQPQWPKSAASNLAMALLREVLRYDITFRASGRGIVKAEE